MMSNADGSLLLQESNLKGVYSFPVVLLKIVEQGNLNIVTFLNPASESDEVTEMAASEIHEDKLYRLVDEETRIINERVAEIFTESNSAIQINPNDVEAYYKRAAAYMLEHDYDSAFKDFNKAIEINPDYTPAITKRGLIYVIKKKYNLAMKDFNRAIELDPGYSSAYLNRGICHYEMGHTDLVPNDLNKVFEMSSDPELLKQARQLLIMCQEANSRLECDKAKAYIKKGKNDQAITNLIKVTESNPSDAYAYFLLGMAYDHQEEYDQAISALDKAIQLDPELLGAHNNRGWVYLKKKLYWSAIADLTEEIRLGTESVIVYLNRGDAYYNTGQPRVAIADLRKALELSSDPEQIDKIKRQIQAIS